MSDIKTKRFSPRKLKKKPTDTVLIRKANDLVEARYKFDIWETRLFLKMLAMIRTEDKDFFEYKIYISDLVKEFKLENSKDTYKRVKEGARKLLTKIIKVVVKDEDKMVELETPIVGVVKKTIEEGDGSYIKLGFYPAMKPFLLELRERYLVYDFRNVSNLPSPYYVRIYELLKQYERIGERRFEVDELKSILGLQQEYKLYGHFKSKILDKAQAKLLEFTDISFTYEEIKKGRAVWSLLFKIHKNRPAGTAVEEDPASAAVFEEGEHRRAAAAPKHPLFDDFFERLNDWWGVEAAEFLKRLENKTSEEVERAIQFTKERIKTGKAQNPAGVFLDALSRNLKTPEQIKIEKKQERERAERLKVEQIKSLVAEYETLIDEYALAINDSIREVIRDFPNVTETVIERIKTTYRMLGERTMQGKTIDDFRHDAMLREMVKAEIMKDFPKYFEKSAAEINPKIEAIKAKVWMIDPSYRFA